MKEQEPVASLYFFFCREIGFETKGGVGGSSLQPASGFISCQVALEQTFPLCLEGIFGASITLYVKSTYHRKTIFLPLQIIVALNNAPKRLFYWKMFFGLKTPEFLLSCL